MKKIILLALLASSASWAFSQELYRKGLIVTLDNDTIYGMINDHGFAYSPVSIEFKKDEASESRQYSSKELKGFTTSLGLYFESYQFKFDGDLLDQGSTNNTGYPTTRTPKNWIDTHAFLIVLAKGKYTLLKYTDRDEREHYFVLEEGKTEPEELQYRTYLSNIGGAPTMVTSEMYKQQLGNYAVTECSESLKGPIMSSKYKDASLISIFKSLNRCFKNVKELPFIPIEKDKLRAPKVGLLFLTSVADPGFVSEAGNESKSNGFGSLLFGGGISVEILSKRNNKSSFYSELKYVKISGEGVYGELKKPASLKFSSFTVTNLFRSTNKKNTFFYNIGITWGMISDIQAYVPGTYPITPKIADAFQAGVTAGVGRKFNPIGVLADLRFSYILPAGATNEATVTEYKMIELVITKQF